MCNCSAFCDQKAQPVHSCSKFNPRGLFGRFSIFLFRQQKAQISGSQSFGSTIATLMKGQMQDGCMIRHNGYYHRGSKYKHVS